MKATGCSETFVPVSNYKASYPTRICGECAVMNTVIKTSDFVITLREIVLGILLVAKGEL